MSRTADWPGQTLNVDLCFVPVSHLADAKLPAVSGSSGHLVIERVKEVGQEPDYPGQAFADIELGYAEAVQAFVQTSQPLFGPKIGVATVEKISPQAKIKQLRQEEAQLCVERRNIRKRRKLEDAAWRVIWSQQRDVPGKREAGNLRARWGSRKAHEEQRQSLREQHRQQARQRQQEDEQWRLDRLCLREQISFLPIVTAWIAILVINDNCEVTAPSSYSAVFRIAALRGWFACHGRDGCGSLAILVTRQSTVHDFRSWHTLCCRCVSTVRQRG